MNNKELLFDYLEDNLDPNLEDELFAQLSLDKQLRLQLKKVLQLNDSVKASRTSLVPSPDVKAKLFTSLGFSTMAFAAGGQASASGRLIPDLFVRYKAYFAASFAASMATIAVIVLLYNTGQIFKNPANDHTNVASGNVYYEELNTNISQGIANSGNTNNSDANIIKENSINGNNSGMAAYLESAESNTSHANNNIIPIEEPKNVLAENNDSGILVPQELLFQNIASINPVENFMISSPAFSSFSNVINTTPIYSMQDNDEEGHKFFTIELSTLNHPLKADPHVNPPSEDYLDNFALICLVNISKYFSAGVDVRNEIIFQNAEYQLEDGQYLLYKQNLKAMSLSLVARYNLKYFGDFVPHVQLSAGANKEGFLARSLVGLTYQLSSNLALSAGYEYGNFWYKIYEQAFEANKSGINYGIMYTF